MITLINKSRVTLPRIPFKEIKNAALSPSYTLTLTFIGPTEMKRLNNQYRNKNKPTDILSFPLSDTEGEIYICASESRREAHNFDRPYNNFLAFLFIHGCVHLKGYDHGSRMEGIETKIRKQFGI